MKTYWTNKRYVCLALLFAGVLLFPEPGWSSKGVVPLDTESPETTPEETVWGSDVDSALGIAAIEFKKVLVFFSSPDCPWCKRLKEELRRKPIAELVQDFKLVKVTPDSHKETFRRYGVRGVPSLLLLNADGKVIARQDGYAAGKELKQFLTRRSQREKASGKDPTLQECVSILQSDEPLSVEQCRKICAALDKRSRRKKLRELIFQRDRFPAKQLIKLLTDSKLAVRLGALELLEEAAGTDMGFDPWQPPSEHERRPALKRWQDWSSNKNDDVESVYSSLTADQVKDYIYDLVSDKRELAVRAMRMLQHGGSRTAETISEFLEGHPDLTSEAKRRVKEVQYTLHIPEDAGVEPAATAHRLVYGDVDDKRAAMKKLKQCGSQVSRIYRDMLDEKEAILRETAIDCLVESAGRKAVPILEKHLQQEEDDDVIYVLLKNLGDLESKRALKILLEYLDSKNEDLVIAALQSLAKLESSLCAPGVKMCLSDSRWRVRAAALKTVRKLSLQQLRDDVEDRLSDTDPFVRRVALQTIAVVGDESVVPKLKKMFKSSDELKASIIKTLVAMDVAIPDALISTLKKSSTDVVQAAVSALSERSDESPDIVYKFRNYPNKDVQVIVLKELARRGLQQRKVQHYLVTVLREGEAEKTRAVVSAIRINDELRNLYGSLVARTPESGNNESRQKRSETVQNTYDAFETAEGDGDNGEKSDSDETSAESVLNAFETTGTDAEGEKQTYGFDELVDELSELRDSSDETVTRFHSARVLANLGSVPSVRTYRDLLPDLTAVQRAKAARSLRYINGTRANRLLRKLLRDDVHEVREAALRAGWQQAKNPDVMKILFNELQRPDAKIEPHQFYVRTGLRKAVKNEKSRGIFRAGARELLESDEARYRTLGIILLDRVWRSKDTAVIKPFLDSSNVFVRRAAYRTLANSAPEKFKKVMEKAANDTSELVRMVVPCAFSRESRQWVHYFSKDKTKKTYGSYRAAALLSSGHDAGSSSLDATQEKLLRKLTRDPSLKVSLEAYFSLLQNKKSIDLDSFVSKLEQVPDRDAIKDRITDFMLNNYKRLDSEFAVLLNFVENRSYQAEKIRRMKNHFDISEDKADSKITELESPNRKLRTSYQKPSAPEKAKKEEASQATEQPIHIAFFFSPGCDECDDVERMFKDVASDTPDFRIEKLNIRKADTMQYNEALCKRFGVKEKLHLVTPAVFGAAGALVKDQISRNALVQLVRRSAKNDNRNWYAFKSSSIEKAETSIEERYSGFNAAVVGVAGLLDSLNPCAFATIIFFLSYLQLRRRSFHEVAITGLAFIAGVFLSYYILGLGFVQIISQLQVLHTVSFWVNTAIAAAAVIIAALSVRDGVLCMQGRMQSMTLQLPDKLKDRIRGLIRHRINYRHFAWGAFVIGAGISFLELACTGQVYAPTILFMLKSGKETFSALMMLLLYNVAFVAPLFVIFGFACFGLRSERLSEVLQKHAAPVKFLTAALFIFLAVFLLAV